MYDSLEKVTITFLLHIHNVQILEIAFNQIAILPLTILTMKKAYFSLELFSKSGFDFV